MKNSKNKKNEKKNTSQKKMTSAKAMEQVAKDIGLLCKRAERVAKGTKIGKLFYKEVVKGVMLGKGMNLNAEEGSFVHSIIEGGMKSKLQKTINEVENTKEFANLEKACVRLNNGKGIKKVDKTCTAFCNALSEATKGKEVEAAILAFETLMNSDVMVTASTHLTKTSAVKA